MGEPRRSEELRALRRADRRGMEKVVGRLQRVLFQTDRRACADLPVLRKNGLGTALVQRWLPRQHCHLHARSEEHTSELQSLMRISYAVLCLKKKKNTNVHIHKPTTTQITNY